MVAYAASRRQLAIFSIGGHRRHLGPGERRWSIYRETCTWSQEKTTSLQLPHLPKKKKKNNRSPRGPFQHGHHRFVQLGFSVFVGPQYQIRFLLKFSCGYDSEKPSVRRTWVSLPSTGYATKT